ncbi:AT-rich interactive domain-containing protein 4A [Fukomys damarensis]|uniref:AT-rich interactive domain-containing protein 4A n=1 Tax=Fukomys damarensis TaxID=885580 RepID=UPI00053F4EDC|nr:AT-rich interactive domain-containing protein 4A [Fukomys damarensis]
MKAADEPAYLTVGTDVSAKYRGAFCEAKIKTVKRLVKVKVLLKQDNTTQLVQDDQVKGPLRVGAVVETRAPDGSFQEAVISKLTDASWYTVVFDDGDERTLRRTSLCLKGERHFAESETLDQLPLTNPEHFGTPVIAKKTNRGRRSSLPVNEDEKEEESSEEEEEDKQRLHDELLGKVVRVVSTPERTEWFPALVVSPSCNDDVPVKKDQCLVRSFIDSKFYAIARKDIKEVDVLNLPESELSTKPGLQKASIFLKARVVPDNWKMDLSEILESSSSDDEVPAEENDEEKEKETKKEEEEVPEEELDPEERDNFLQQLYKFMEDRGTPINKPPVLGYKDLNLFKLFRLVYHQGGCDNIDSGAVWKQIYMDLGIPILNSAASYNVKTAYRKYLYGFEEYCRSANIRFRTIHHHEPKVKVEKKDLDESMEEAVKVDQEMPLVEVKSELEENTDSNSESEREELELKSPRGQRRIARDANSIKKETEEEKTEDKFKDNDSEHKDVEDDYDTAEKDEDGLVLGRKSTPKPKEKKVRKQEGSDRDSEGEGAEAKSREREETESRCDSEGEDEDDAEPCLTGTKVKVKYGRGKTQKIYEASIKSTEIDDGEVLYLVHYYGWNVRYDEWVKADRIIWPLDKGGPKKKQKKKAKNKEDSEKDEKREEERQRTKRGRPPLRSSLPSGPPFGLPTAAHGDGKSDSCSSDSETEDPLEKSLLNEELFPDSKEELEKDENLNDDKLDEENPKLAGYVLKENDRTAAQPLETLQLEGGENEQMVQLFGNQGEEVKKEAEKSPKGKGRRSKTKDISLEMIKMSSFEPPVDAQSPESSSLDGSSGAAGEEADPCGKERKLKRKVLGQPSPEKRSRMENGVGCAASGPEHEGMPSLMPSLTAEASQGGTAEESPEGPAAGSLEAGAGPAACSFLAQERESREKGQKRPSDGNGGLMAKKQKRTPKRTSAAAKNEKNGAGQSSDSEDLPAVNNSSKCTPVKHLSVSKPPKLARSPARISPHIKDGEKEKQREKHPTPSPRTYKWSLQLHELDNMNSTERISFLQEKLQEIRKYYMSLKSEVATIDRRRKRLKQKDREVSHVGASMSSASSDTGMSPSSSSPPQNVLAVECR